VVTPERVQPPRKRVCGIRVFGSGVENVEELLGVGPEALLSPAADWQQGVIAETGPVERADLVRDLAVEFRKEQFARKPSCDVLYRLGREQSRQQGSAEDTPAGQYCCLPGSVDCGQPDAATMTCPDAAMPYTRYNACEGLPPVGVPFAEPLGLEQDAAFPLGCTLTFPFCSHRSLYGCICSSSSLSPFWNCGAPGFLATQPH